MTDSEHRASRSVSAATYKNGCRCAGCREAWRIASLTLSSHQAYQLARRRAGTWLRAHHPDEWEQLLAAAYVELGVERRPIGRPPKAAS